MKIAILENTFHFTPKRSGSGVIYSGKMNEYNCTIHIAPRFRYGPTNQGAAYAGDIVSIIVQCSSNTRLIIGNVASTAVSEAIDKRWSTHPMRPVLVNNDFLKKLTLKSIDPSWSQRLLNEDTISHELSTLFPSQAGITVLQILPDAIWWKTHVVLGNITEDHWRTWIQALGTFVSTVATQPSPTITDVTTQLERNWVLNTAGASRRGKLYGFGCIGFLLLGIGLLIIILLKVEGQL